MMKILLSGVETNNKGAELMLYAILQEIERRFPNSTVYISPYRIKQGIKYIHTSLDFRLWPYYKAVSVLKLYRIFSYLHLPYSLLPHSFKLRDVDYYFDGSGFLYSDKFRITNNGVIEKKQFLGFLLDHGCKIIYLPQAFGPTEKTNTKKMLEAISDYSTLLLPREKVSYDYLKTSGVVNMDKVKIFPDFTSLVEGIFPSNYISLKNGICVIPNVQMINKGAISLDSYLVFLRSVISYGRTYGKQVYLLNHEGAKDRNLCLKIKEKLSGDIVVVTGLNALEVKGLIGSAYLVVSSRFHGVVSSLNSCVPCLATSWSHKYEELFKDYNVSNCILPLNDIDQTMEMIRMCMDSNHNQSIRNNLRIQVPLIREKNREMWETIWKC